VQIAGNAWIAWVAGKGDFGAREARKAMVIDSLRGRFEGKGKKIPVREKRDRRANSHHSLSSACHAG